MELLLEEPCLHTHLEARKSNYSYFIHLIIIRRIICESSSISCFILKIGTRIVYERNFLMQMRQSPLAKTPPANLPVIPGVTVPASTSPNKNCASSPKKTNDSGDSERRTSSMDCPSKLQAVPGEFTFRCFYFTIFININTIIISQLMYICILQKHLKPTRRINSALKCKIVTKKILEFFIFT